MPAWSPEIANHFIRLAAGERRALDQVQLQKLVYIAHGWCLATTGQPLTGDRPEAWEFGPVYRRIADLLAPYGLDPITREIATGELSLNARTASKSTSILARSELDLIRRVYEHYGGFSGSRLSNITRRGNAPWKDVHGDGSGLFRDIPHELIRAQFVQLAREATGGPELR